MWVPKMAAVQPNSRNSQQLLEVGYELWRDIKCSAITHDFEQRAGGVASKRYISFAVEVSLTGFFNFTLSVKLLYWMDSYALNQNELSDTTPRCSLVSRWSKRSDHYKHTTRDACKNTSRKTNLLKQDETPIDKMTWTDVKIQQLFHSRLKTPTNLPQTRPKLSTSITLSSTTHMTGDVKGRKNSKAGTRFYQQPLVTLEQQRRKQVNNIRVLRGWSLSSYYSRCLKRKVYNPGPADDVYKAKSLSFVGSWNENRVWSKLNDLRWTIATFWSSGRTWRDFTTLWVSVTRLPHTANKTRVFWENRNGQKIDP